MLYTLRHLSIESGIPQYKIKQLAALTVLRTAQVGDLYRYEADEHIIRNMKLYIAIEKTQAKIQQLREDLRKEYNLGSEVL